MSEPRYPQFVLFSSYYSCWWQHSSCNLQLPCKYQCCVEFLGKPAPLSPGPSPLPPTTLALSPSSGVMSLASHFRWDSPPSHTLLLTTLETLIPAVSMSTFSVSPYFGQEGLTYTITRNKVVFWCPICLFFSSYSLWCSVCIVRTCNIVFFVIFCNVLSSINI